MPKIPGISQRAFLKGPTTASPDKADALWTNGKQRLIIPRHNPINAITMGSIAKSAGLTPDEFRKLP